jgi:hypothetical protein
MAGYSEGVGQGVAANVAFSATCAVCTVFGWSQIPDPNDPKNWPIWVAVLIAFGILTSLGAGANAARLWWKKHKIAVASLERFTVILAIS